MDPTQAFSLDRSISAAPADEADSAGAPPPPVAVPLKLVLVPSGMSVELTRPEVTVGRHSSCDVCLPVGDVSRRHCRFVHQGGTWEVEDLDSLNGVYVNDQRIRHSALAHRDRLRIGSMTFEVRIRASGLGLCPRPERRAS